MTEVNTGLGVLLLKRSGGRFYFQKPPYWYRNPEKAPEKMKERWLAFKKAVDNCKDKSKRREDVWTPSEYNRCISEKLKKVV